jgi:predicted CXXCH cytochrome family protein
LVLAFVLGLGPALFALDPPHVNLADNCGDCHLPHNAPGMTLATVAGAGNLCLSCHMPGGSAALHPFVAGEQALPGPGLPAGVSPAGRSHRWDSGAAGHAAFVGGAVVPSTGRVEPRGVFTGPYPKTYFITITTPGGTGTARFNWTATMPGGGGGTNILTGTNVPLDEGVAVTFVNGTTNISFQLNDLWRVFVRPDLRHPTNTALLGNVINGQMSCATCHDGHSQAKNPFDAAATPYGPDVTNRHYLAMDSDVDQMCLDCHAPRAVTTAAAGSHPVGVAVVSNAFYRTPTLLLLDKTVGQMRCSTCHQVHSAPGDDGSLVRLTNHVALCSDCHQLADVATPASHLNRTNGALWPGGQYGSLFPAITDAAKRGDCGNCHQAHGWPDAAAPTNHYPLLLVDREENFCFTCHDGSPVAKNLRTNFAKAYSHPITNYSGRHFITELTSANGIAAYYGSTNRHAECADCHNVHASAYDAVAPVPPLASGHLRGVSRVAVVNISAGSVSYTFRGPKNAAPVREYELCFLCHSAWTTLPSGKTDYAAKFNTFNPSFHPVEAQGKNLNIHSNSFVNGWRATNTMYCSHCHTSDDTTIRGPHGSTNQYILKKRAVASSASRTMSSGELCFDCHRYDTYANKDASTTIKGYSRFNLPAFEKGHTYHVGEQRFPCYACHDSHGSATKDFLIVTGRSPGLNTYTRTANGGTCAPTCHGSESYNSLNYPR